MRSIVCVHELSAHYQEQIRRIAPDYSLVCGRERDAWLSLLADAEIIVGWNADAMRVVTEAGTKLRWVQNWGAGVDRLPFDAFARKGIVLTNTSGVHAYPIAETIFAMMLALTRQLHTSVKHQLRREWKPAPAGEIHGKTIGIVGVGAIGEETAKIARAFGMEVLGVRSSGQPSPYVDRMYGSDGLDEVLRASDYIVVTVPLTERTAHMIGERQFATMKRGAYYFNVGRGGTTDEAALVRALRTGDIAGAGLDVFEREPLPADSPLWDMDNVIVSPHHSGATVHYEERAVAVFLRNLADYVAGKEPSLNRVDLARQY